MPFNDFQVPSQLLGPQVLHSQFAALEVHAYQGQNDYTSREETRSGLPVLEAESSHFPSDRETPARTRGCIPTLPIQGVTRLSLCKDGSSLA